MTTPTGVSTNEVVEEVQALPSDQVEYLRRMGRESIYVLGRGVLGYRQVTRATHGAYCKFFEESPKLRRLGLMPRAHLKTTLATVTDSVRHGVRDPENCRILIINETFDGAADIVDEIKGHFEKNKLLRSLYPEAIPEKFAGPGVDWGRGSATLPRQRTVYKESTWMAAGVGTAVVGKHFPRIKVDDIIGFEASNSPAKMEEAKAFIRVIEPLLVNQATDIIDYTGTRWLLHDVYGYLMQFYKSRLAVFAREAIENGKIIFPEMHTMEEYQTLMDEAPDTWYSQYCNNPLAAGQIEFPNMVREFRFSLDGESVELIDPDKIKRYKISELNRYITVDPNGGERRAPDEAAISIQGITPDNDVVVLEDFGGRPTPSEFVDLIFEKAKRWDAHELGIEKVGMSTTYHYFNEKAREEDYHIHVVPLTPGRLDKRVRIRKRLEPVLRSKRLYALSTQTGIRGQIAHFPQTELIDRMDALAYGPELWRKPLRIEDEEENEKVLKLVMSRRSRRTGY